MNITTALYSLLNTHISSAQASHSLTEELTDKEMEALYALSKQQDLAHIVGYELNNLGRLRDDEISQKFKRQILQAVYRQSQMENTCQQVYQLFTQLKIPFIPLKGAILRAYYPEPWMRTSCDIDILVKEEDLDNAIAALQQKLQYTVSGRTDHDISFNSTNGVHLELHYDTVGKRSAINNCRDVLSGIWDDAQVLQPGSSQYCMSDAMFYFYHIAHMAKHFQNGGCGIRPFLDIWIMHHRISFDKEKRNRLLQQGGLLSFAQAAEQLAEVWFTGAKPDALSQQISDYIFSAGLFGNNANRAAVGQAKMGGKLQYLLFRRVFLPYDFLKAEYPILKKHKWLTPIYQVIRWIRMLRNGKLRQTAKELQANMKTDGTAIASNTEMLKQLGLSK